MIYKNKLLVIRIVFQSLHNRPIYGVFRPQAYMEETGKYSSNLRFNLFKKEITPGQKTVFETILESPVGFGHHLKEGALFTIKDGLDIIGKAVLVEVIGYLDELKMK